MTTPQTYSSRWANGGAFNDDPIAQTFRINKDMAPDADGVYLTSVDLYFQSKAPNLGCTVDLRTVENGYPTRTSLPYSMVHLLYKQIHVSDDASAVTRVIFPGPVYCKVGEQYAIAIKPDGGHPDLKIWVNITGKEDIATGTLLTTNWGDGAFFASASDAWLPKFDRDLKFKVYAAQFDLQKTGTVTLTNDDVEYLTVSVTSGTFQNNEEVYKVPASFNSGKVTTTVGNATVTGTTTSFASDYEIGDTIVIRDNANNAIADVVTIKSIESDTSMTVVGAAKVGIANGAGALTPTGLVRLFNANTGYLEIFESTAANTSHRFEATDVIKGCDSTANATITSVNNPVLSYFQPHIHKTEVGASIVTSEVRYAASANLSSTVTKPVIYGITNHIKDVEAAVFSKSNEANTTGITKSFVVVNTLKTNKTTSGPMLETSTPTVQIYENVISSNNTGERTVETGSANSKYVSKVVTLASGLEAEDLQVYVTAYKPANTNIEVYAKFINIADSDNPSSRQWTKLEETASQTTTFSSSKNARDLREFAFYLPPSPTLDSTTKQAGTANTVGNTSTIAIASASTYYSADDIIVVSDSIRSDYALGRVQSANSTVVTLYEPLDDGKDFTNSFHYKVAADEKRSAFKYPVGSYSYKLVYFDAAGREYNNFNFFQIKVVLLADQTNLVPRIGDVRAIALSG